MIASSKGMPTQKKVLFFSIECTIKKLLPDTTRDANIQACAHDGQAARTQACERYSQVGLQPQVADLSYFLLVSNTKVEYREEII